MASNKAIVNISVGHLKQWHHNGQKRLIKSLIDVGPLVNVDVLTQKYVKPKTCNVYLDKIQSIIDAYNKGYTHILYLDCSITAIRHLDDIWNYIDSNGYYLYKSGYNCANTSSDNVLQHFGLSRDTVEQWPEAATNVIGINTQHWLGEKMIRELQMKYIPECVNTIKWPNADQRKKDSTDERFLFSRQDQTVISLIAGKYNMKIEEHNHYVMRDEDDNIPNPSVIFKLKGGF